MVGTQVVRGDELVHLEVSEPGEDLAVVPAPTLGPRHLLEGAEALLEERDDVVRVEASVAGGGEHTEDRERTSVPLASNRERRSSGSPRT